MCSGVPYRPGMDRRRFLLSSLVGVLGAPLGVDAQQAGKMYRIGYLSLAREDYGESFRQGLRDWVTWKGNTSCLKGDPPTDSLNDFRNWLPN